MKFICKQCVDSSKPCIVDIGDYSCFAPDSFDCVLKSRNERCKWERVPQLTAEVFEREDCPKWAMYAFVGSCGSAFFIDVEPKMSEDGIMWCWNVGARRQPIPGVFDESDWQNSLIKRPEKKTLPDWCKPGEWVYWRGFTVGCEYFKIAKISDGLVFDETGFAHQHTDLKQARLRPFNADEMRGLVGKVIEVEPGQFSLCLREKGLWADFLDDCDNEDDRARIISYDCNMLKHRNTIDGSLCGVLEHFDTERKKWVK